jgi:UDP-glucose 4-epimerase
VPNLVVGSRGFIGSSLVAHLNKDQLVLIEDEISLLRLAETEEVLVFDNVYWLAGSAKPSTSILGPLVQHPDYVSLYKFLTHSFVKFKRFLFLSSGGCVYGLGNSPFHEKSPTNPINQYGELKLLCEQIVTQTHADKSVVFRASNIHGVNQQAKKYQGVIPYWMREVLNGKPLTIYGDLSDYRDYLSVQDLVEAFLKVHESNAFGIFNIGSGETFSINQMLEVFSNVLGFEPRFELHPRRSGDLRGYVLNVSKAKETLGWMPSNNSTISIRATVDLLYQDIKE